MATSLVPKVGAVGSIAQYATDSSGNVTGLVLPSGSVRYLPYVLAQWGVPSGVAPTGVITNNGALTLGTALNLAYSNGIYLYFPANAIFAGSAAGSYWCVMSSTTAGTIYQETLSGVPTYIAAPTPWVTIGPGAYVGETAEVTVATVTVPGGAMGPNGRMIVDGLENHNNSATTKTPRIKFGGTNIFTSAQSTNMAIGLAKYVYNRGISNSQICTAVGNTGTGTASQSNLQLSVDTAVNFDITYTSQLGAATDTSVWDGGGIEITYKK